MTRLVLTGDILLGNVNTSPKSKDVENTNDIDCDIGMGQESCAMDVNSRGMNLIKLVPNKPLNLCLVERQNLEKHLSSAS